MYARLRAESGFHSDRLVAREDGRIVGGLQVLARGSPVGTFAYLQRAPLSLDSRADVLNCLLDEFDRLARRNSYVSVCASTFPTQQAARTALERIGFEPSSAWFVKERSFLIPLSRGDDEILARMKQKSRYNVRLAQRSGVDITPGDLTSIGEFYDLHRLSGNYKNFPIFPQSYFEYLLRMYGNAGRMKIFVARHAGKAIAAILNFAVGGHSYYGWGGMSREPEHKKLMANYLLHFTGMRWARDLGCSGYDLVGVSDFKERMGGEEIHWSLPQRKFYGLWRGVRRKAAEATWTKPFLRSCVNRLRRRLYGPMPY
jgi:lipid II:glycine glycyltransferase (peptidoglycan interpeptide bridge formation enzyme)